MRAGACLPHLGGGDVVVVGTGIHEVIVSTEADDITVIENHYVGRVHYGADALGDDNVGGGIVVFR